MNLDTNLLHTLHQNNTHDIDFLDRFDDINKAYALIDGTHYSKEAKEGTKALLIEEAKRVNISHLQKATDVLKFGIQLLKKNKNQYFILGNLDLHDSSMPKGEDRKKKAMRYHMYAILRHFVQEHNLKALCTFVESLVQDTQPTWGQVVKLAKAKNNDMSQYVNFRNSNVNPLRQWFEETYHRSFSEKIQKEYLTSFVKKYYPDNQLPTFYGLVKDSKLKEDKPHFLYAENAMARKMYQEIQEELEKNI